jgi:4-amino-4-deoxy-L-arabinose transferase-like glycosyltransferase
MLPRLSLPPSHAVLVLIALAFVAPGLVGHDPWRAFDVIAIEIVNQMHLSGDWIVPQIAGVPYLDDPPLYHWIALAFVKLLGWALGLHNAVRLASGLSMMAALWFIYLAARHTAPDKPRAAGASATLLLIGSVGLMMHAHEAVPDLAMLAALCAALNFLIHAGRRPLKAGLGFGAALGCAFLANGPLVPAVLGAVAVLAHAVCDQWRTAKAPLFLGAAAAVFALFALSWPLALWLRAPELVQAWWLEATRPRGGFGENLRYYLSIASWFAWPAWPVAAWSAWVLRREWRTPRVFVPLAAAIFGLLAIAWLGPQQDINVIVLLAPLALLGAHGVARLRRGAANALDWFGVMTFSFFAGLIWLAYVAMVTGVPPKIANNFARTSPGYLPQFEPLHFAVALALTAGWLYLVFFSAPSPTRGVTRWAAGIALLWGCFATLWMPWADHIKSYRGVALQLKAALPASPGCIAQSELAAPQRAALSYHAGIVTTPWRAKPPAAASGAAVPACRYLIVQGNPKEERSPGPGWRKVAEANRPADRGERYRLYRYGPG